MTRLDHQLSNRLIEQLQKNGLSHASITRITAIAETYLYRQLDEMVILNIFLHERRCGTLIKVTSNASSPKFLFWYTSEYLVRPDAIPLSLSLPLSPTPYISDHLFGYFDNLVSEGWLKKLQCTQLRINPSDHFSLLRFNGKDMAGAVTITYQAE